MMPISHLWWLGVAAKTYWCVSYLWWSAIECCMVRFSRRQFEGIWQNVSCFVCLYCIDANPSTLTYIQICPWCRAHQQTALCSFAVNDHTVVSYTKMSHAIEVHNIAISIYETLSSSCYVPLGFMPGCSEGCHNLEQTSSPWEIHVIHFCSRVSVGKRLLLWGWCRNFRQQFPESRIETQYINAIMVPSCLSWSCTSTPVHGRSLLTALKEADQT